MSALIEPAELARALGSVVVVDVRWNLAGPPGRAAYLTGHIPSAHFVDLDAELAGPPGPGGRHPMPCTASIQATLRHCGVDPGSTIVVYDAATSQAAARAWWVFRAFGAGEVRVLDGGLAAWEAAGLPVTSAVPPPGAGTFEARAGGMPLLDAGGAAAVARDGVLLDARSPERYAGEQEPVDPVAGHIPGSVSAPMEDYVQEDGRFRPGEELRAYFAGKGVVPGVRVGTTCGSGVTAAHEALALHEIGVEAEVYVGSWSEWIRDPARAVATGSEPSRVATR